MLIETVGAGQGDVEISQIADQTVVVCPPGLGDELQAMKAGLMEVADLFVVNKADLPGAAQVCTQLRRIARRRGEDAPRPVVKVSGLTGEGTDELVDHLTGRRGQPSARAATREDTSPAAVHGPLQGRVAIVTGASGGLGRRFARILHTAGATVYVVARRKDPLDDLAAELGERIVPVPCDVTTTRTTSIELMSKKSAARLDIVVNSAGLGDVIAAEGRTRSNSFKRVIDVELGLGVCPEPTRSADHARARVRNDHRHSVGPGARGLTPDTAGRLPPLRRRAS